MTDLLECGIIGIENLHLRRKHFSNFHIIYMIEPSDIYIRRMMEDFQEEIPESIDPSTNQKIPA